MLFYSVPCSIYAPLALHEGEFSQETGLAVRPQGPV